MRGVHQAALGRGPIHTITIVAIGAASLLAAPTLLAQETDTIAADGSVSSFLTTLGELVVGGGVLMIPIGLASILTLGLAIERLWALRRGRILPDAVWSDVKIELEGGNIVSARERVAGRETALHRMLAAGLDRWDDGRDELSDELEESGQREADELQMHLPALQGIASVAPLLGLLGTVVGMIRSFYTIAKESVIGNPELFAEPIGQALVTTAAGLTVAIPALILFYWFRGRIRKLVRALNDVSRDVVRLRRRAAGPALASVGAASSPGAGV